MVFDAPQAELPTATLRPTRFQARHRLLAGQLHRWLAARWAWLHPRSVPLLVALAGMLAVLDVTRYLSAYARGDQRRATVVYVEKPTMLSPGGHGVRITLAP